MTAASLSVPPADARARRSRQALWDAALQLARHTPAEQLSVTALCTAAGVSRPTFYRHAESPLDLLTQALEAEWLTAAYLAFGADPDRTLKAAFAVAARLTAAHLERHEALYLTALEQPGASPAVWQRLALNYEQWFRALLTHPTLPTPLGANPFFAEAYAAHRAQATLGVMRAWMRLPSPRDPELFVQVLEDLEPAWLRELWPRPLRELPSVAAALERFDP